MDLLGRQIHSQFVVVGNEEWRTGLGMGWGRRGPGHREEGWETHDIRAEVQLVDSLIHHRQCSEIVDIRKMGSLHSDRAARVLGLAQFVSYNVELRLPRDTIRNTKQNHRVEYDVEYSFSHPNRYSNSGRVQDRGRKKLRTKRHLSMEQAQAAEA